MLRKIIPRHLSHKIYGADVEGDGLQGAKIIAIVGDGVKEVFYDIKDFTKFLKSHAMRSARIFFHNLTYDFGCLIDNFDLNYKIFDVNGDIFKIVVRPDTKNPIYFLDSSNFYPGFSVSNLGEMIGLHKYPIPPMLLGEEINYHPEEWYCEEHNKLWCETCYCLRDAEIVYRAMKMFYDVVEGLGGEVGFTLASTAMKLFKCVYLDEEYLTPFEWKNDFARQAYFAGRVENYVRGWWEDVLVYDINSAYPWAMTYVDLPNPNTLKIVDYPTNFYKLLDYEGVAVVDIYIKPTDLPLLPVKVGEFTVYPYGELRGCWTHLEIRRAIEEGAVIKQFHSSLYSLSTCKPLERYARELYALRQKYKAEKNPFEVVVKILLNSLYGKFGQRNDSGLCTWEELTNDIEDLTKYEAIEAIGDKEFGLRKLITPQPNYINVLWACYITAGVRLKLFDYVKSLWDDVYYCDTDSIHTTKMLPTSTELGGLKLEKCGKWGLYVNPKEYLITDEDKNVIMAKAKGVRRIAATQYLLEGRASFTKPIRFREGIRRKIHPSAWIEVVKERKNNIPKRKFPILDFDPDLSLRSQAWEINEFTQLVQKIPREVLFSPVPVI